MQPHGDRVDETVYSFAGPVIGERAEQGDWTRPAGAERVLLVSLGSAFTDHLDFYRRCVTAFGDLPGWHTVLQVGRHVDPAALGPVPSTVEVRRWVPQVAILRRADAFLTHAGMGGSAEGLFTGTPMLVAPQAADQFGNADRLVELGVARRVDTATSTAADLRAALLALTADPGVGERLAGIQAEMRRGDAASLVEAELLTCTEPGVG
jgi:MGT family glycosyltransferase